MVEMIVMTVPWRDEERERIMVIWYHHVKSVQAGLDPTLGARLKEE